MKFVENSKIMKHQVLIGKTGCIRFKKNQVQQFNLMEDKRLLVGYDMDEKPVSHIYIVNPTEELKDHGYKVMYQNKSHFIQAKTICNELNLPLPLKCTFEPYSDGVYTGFRLVLPKTSTLKTN